MGSHDLFVKDNLTFTINRGTLSCAKGEEKKERDTICSPTHIKIEKQEDKWSPLNLFIILVQLVQFVN